MNIVLGSLAVLLTVFAAYVIACNYGAIVVNLRNKRLGIDRHISQSYILPQLCLLLAYLASIFSPDRLLSSWVLLALALADPSLWFLVALPVLVRRR